VQKYKKDIIQTNNLVKNDKIQGNNSTEFDKIQRNIIELLIVSAYCRFAGPAAQAVDQDLPF
jgi:hypothetical protein